MSESVYRDGDRIRRNNGTGYHDRVPDAEIRKHMHTSAHDREFMAFAKAVLAIREFERVAKETTDA